MEATSGRISVGGVLSESFRIYGQHAATLLLSALAIFVVVGVIEGLLQAAGGVLLLALAWVVSLVGLSLYTGLVVKVVQEARAGDRHPSVGEMLRSVQGVLGSLVVNSVLRSIAIGIGFLLLIVPGLILLTLWAVTSPAIVVERRGPIEAFGRSWQLVRGNGWGVFGVLVVVFLLMVVVGLIIGAIATGTTAGGIVVGIIGNLIYAPVFALVAAVIFFDLGGGAPAPAAATAPGTSPVSEPPVA